MQYKRQLANELIDSLRNRPHEWVWKNHLYYSLCHQLRGSKIEIWIANGEFNLREPYDMKFGWVDHFRLRSAFKKWERERGQELRSSEEERGIHQTLKMLRGENYLRRVA